MSCEGIVGQRTLHFDGSPLGEYVLEVDFTNYDCKAWDTHALRVAVSYDAEQPSSELSVDFVDPQIGGRKRVFRDDSGALDFVSDNLGQGWLVPRRHSNDRPMNLVLRATGVEGAGVGPLHVFVEMWWERRGSGR